MEELFCTPVRTIPKANANRLSLSQRRKKKTTTEGADPLTSSQASSVPDSSLAKRRPSCLSVEPNFTIEPVSSTPNPISHLLNGIPDVEMAEETAPVTLGGKKVGDPANLGSAIQKNNGKKDENDIEKTAAPPKIRVRSFAQYISPKKTGVTPEPVQSEDVNDVIVLSSDEEPSPAKIIKTDKCATNFKQETPKKRGRKKKEPSTTTKIEVRRKLTKSTNLKNITSKYFDASQTRIDNFFTVEKNPKSVGYYETFKKSEIVDFKNHSSKVADHNSILKADIERMKESAGKIFVDIEEENSRDNKTTVHKVNKNYSDVTNLKPGEAVRVHVDNLQLLNDREVNKENEGSPVLPLERSDNCINKSNLPGSIAEDTKKGNQNSKSVRGKRTRKRIVENNESSSEPTAADDPCSYQESVAVANSTSDCSDFVLPRPRKACKRLSFTSSSTSRNLRSRTKNSTLPSTSSNDISVARKISEKPKTTDATFASEELNIAQDLETAKKNSTHPSSSSNDISLAKNESKNSKTIDVSFRPEHLNVGQNLETIDESIADINDDRTTNVHIDEQLYADGGVNAPSENAAASKTPLREIDEIDLTTLLDTPEQKQKFRTPVSTAPKSRGKIGSTTRKGFGNRTSNKKKRNTRMECPAYKVVEGTKFAVDGFRFGEIEGVTHYFLTHFHADHYIGLKKSFAMPVYLSVISCKLVEKMIGTDKQYLHPVEIEKPFEVDGIEITAIDANHCPGAVMFLFKFPTGLCTLHTGDFRASIFMEEGPVFWNNAVHTIYLDTTYLNSKYDFKPQCESIQDALDVVKQFKLKHIGEKILFVCGSYVIGKEKIWTEIAEENNLKVWSEENRRKAIDCIGDDRIKKLLVDDPREANLHILNLGKLHYDYLWQYLDQFHDQFSTLLAIRPSGWEKNSKPQYRGRVNIVGIEYSEHSSYNELRRFIRFLQPHKIISTVPQSSDLSQTVKIPNNWYSNDVRSRRKGYQSSLTNYVKSTKKQVPKPKEPDRSNLSSSGSMSDDIGMLDATEISFKNQQEALWDSDYMS